MQDIESKYRNQLHFYSNNKTSEKEVKKMISFTVALKTIKYLGVNLTKEVKGLYDKK